MNFLAPGRLALLVVVAAFAATYVLAQRRRTKYVVRFTNMDLLETVAPRRPGPRRHLPAAALLVAMTAMVVGLARPAHTQLVAREQGVIVLAVDISPSMMATDVAPSRLDAAQAAVDRFLDGLPDGIRLGLVTFAGTAQVVVPPTDDHQLIRQGVDNLTYRSETGLGEAIYASLDALALEAAGGPLPAAGVVLMSDGAQTTGRSERDAAQQARDAGVPVSTISFGTPQGEIVLSGQTIPVPPDPDTLRDIAQLTEGRAFEAATAQELTAVYQTIGRSVETVEVHQELMEWFLAAALILAMVAGGLSLLWFSRLP